MEYKTSSVDDLIPYATNARTHSDEQVAQIAASIREFGFINPIVIDGDKSIIAGHGRLMAARKLGLAEVPILEVTHLSEAQRKAYVLVDNQLGLNSLWDDELLQAELEQLAEFDFNLDDFGLPEVGETDELFDLGDDVGAGETEKEPKKTDDGYASFELIMEHDNKVNLVRVLNKIKSDHQLESLEQAMVVLVESYSA